MLNPLNIPADKLAMVKRHLKVTWSDTDTDTLIGEKMVDAELALNHKLGATVDYFAGGQERQLYLNYVMYMWNDCLDDFDGAYGREINELHRKYEVLNRR